MTLTQPPTPNPHKAQHRDRRWQDADWRHDRHRCGRRDHLRGSLLVRATHPRQRMPCDCARVCQQTPTSTCTSTTHAITRVVGVHPLTYAHPPTIHSCISPIPSLTQVVVLLLLPSQQRPTVSVAALIIDLITYSLHSLDRCLDRLIVSCARPRSSHQSTRLGYPNCTAQTLVNKHVCLLSALS